MKYFITIAAVILFTACNSRHNKKEDSTHSIHSDSTTAGAYNMLFTFNPDTPAEEFPAQITLKPVRKNADSAVILEIQHEKKIHLIIVSQDLSLFKHLHPIEQPNGTYTLTDSFQQAGVYLLYADYKPAGSEKKVDLKELSVTGRKVFAIDYETQQLQSKTNGYTVNLKPADTRIVSDKETMIVAEINNSNGALTIDKLENYLGEKAHMVIIGISSKKYIHVHPMVMDNKLMLHTTFPEAGLYRAWLEFKKDGKVNIGNFVIKVSPGNTETKTINSARHEH